MQCVDIVEGLVQHGRLTLKQIVERANSSHKEDNYLLIFFFSFWNCRSAFHGPIGVLNAWISCISWPNCVLNNSEPFLASPTEEDMPARKRGAKSAKIIVYLRTIYLQVLVK